MDDCAEAIKAHVKLIGQMQLAEMEQRSNVLMEIEPLVGRFRTACNGETGFQKPRRHTSEPGSKIGSGKGVKKPAAFRYCSK